MTPERLQEIRAHINSSLSRYHACLTVAQARELLEEIDRLRKNFDHNLNEALFVERTQGKTILDLIEERDSLIAEKSERNKWISVQGEILVNLKDENEKFRNLLRLSEDTFDVISSQNQRLIDENEKLREENRKKRYKHAAKLIQDWTIEDYEKENQHLKVRIQNLKQALVFWLSSTPTNQAGKYDEIKNWHAARAQEVLEQDSKYEKEFAAHWKDCLAQDDQDRDK